MLLNGGDPVSTTVFADRTAAAAKTFTYSVVALHGDQTAGRYASIRVLTPEPELVDPRQVGVRTDTSI